MQLRSPETPTEISSDPTYTQLRRLIIEGHFPPGMRLIEERLASELGVSRTPVRQALARVAADGLVQIFPNRGAVVRTFTSDDLNDSFALRAELEGYAAQQAARNLSITDLAELEHAMQALEASLQQPFANRTAEVHFLVEQNQRFHGTIVAASGNRRLGTVLPQVIDIPFQFRSFYWYSPEERQISNFFHRTIFNALHHRDGSRARAMMIEHILRGRDFLLTSLAESERQRGTHDHSSTPST
jgi:DNA-binding GntR family transcriptional regulator